MICPVCGSELREDAKFCNVCGFEIGIENQINIREIRQKITKFRLPNFVEEVEPTWRDCPLCGKPVVKSIGEYGEFCACATYPICKFACDEDELDELTNSPLLDCPICKDGKILPRKGRYGKFYGCSNYPQCNFTVSEDDLDKLASMEIKRCPNCGGYLLLRILPRLCKQNCIDQRRSASLQGQEYIAHGRRARHGGTEDREIHGACQDNLPVL